MKASIALRDRSPRFTPDEYFAWEEKQFCRHEYIDGEVYAMTGGSQNHGRIAANVIYILKGHLRGSGCQVGSADCRVNIAETNDYVYPDVSVTCDPRDISAKQAIKYPCLVVEVLSPGTANYDRGDKFRMYRRNPSLQDYLLVDAEKITVDLYCKNVSGNWEIVNYREGETIALQSINLNFPIEDIYEDIIL
jgi:Uma2 family endonuclease